MGYKRGEFIVYFLIHALGMLDLTETESHCKGFSADILTVCQECNLPLVEGGMLSPSKPRQETYSISFSQDNVPYSMRRWICEWDIPIHPDLGCVDIEGMIEEIRSIIGRKCDDGIHFIRVIQGRRSSYILSVEGAGIGALCDWCFEFRKGMKRMAEKKGLVFEQQGEDFEKCEPHLSRRTDGGSRVSSTLQA